MRTDCGEKVSDTFSWTPAPVVAIAAEHEHEGQGEAGHSHMSEEQFLSTGLWSGLAVVIVLALAAGLLIGARVLRRRAQRRRPCPDCGLFFDPARDPACPSCGRKLGPDR